MTKSKTTGFKKIQEHSDRDEIVEKLIGGVPVRKIEAWLKQKYPHNKKLHVSYISLQSYRKNHLQIEAEVLKDLQDKRKALQIEKRHEQQTEQVQNLHVYQAGMANYVQDSLIDYNAMILDLIDECKDGIGHLKDLNIDKGHHLNHTAISGYISNLKGVLEMHHKMVEAQEKKAGDRIAEDYEMLEKKMEILIEAIKEAFQETNPEGLFTFTAIVKDKMKEAGISE